MCANARAPPPASTRPRLRPASRSARSDTASRTSPSATVSRHASVAATQATRSAGAGRGPMTTRSGWKPSVGTSSGTPLPARATRTTASDCRRQKSRQEWSEPAATPSATSRTRSPSSSARARPSAPTVPGSTTERCVARRAFRWWATSWLPLPACRPTTAITCGCTARCVGCGQASGAHLSRHLGEHGPGRSLVAVEQPVERHARHLDQRRVPACPHTGGPRLAGEQRELAHDGTWRQGPEQLRLPGRPRAAHCATGTPTLGRRPRGTATRRHPG